MLVVFSGMDGAGKSTQIRFVKESNLVSRKQIVSVWARGGYTPGFKKLKRLVGFSSNNKNKSALSGERRDELFENELVSRIWLFIAILDLLVFYAVYVRFLSLSGKVVICDRYIEDTRLDFEKNFPKYFRPNGLLWKALCVAAPTPDVAFLLIVPVAVSMERSLLKSDDFPDSKGALEWRYNKYADESIFPCAKYDFVDCSLPIEEVQKIVTGRLKDHFGEIRDK